MSGDWGSQGFPPGSAGDGPDWAAMAEANERDARRRKLRLRVIVGAVGAVVLTGIVGAAVAVQGSGGPHPSAGQQPAATAPDTGGGPGTPTASGSTAGSPSAAAPSGSAPGSAAPSATGPSGRAQAAPSGATPVQAPGVQLGPAAQVGTVAGHSGSALTLAGNGDGWAEAGPGGIDTAGSFTVSAVVRNNAATDPKAAVSQGGDAFFSLYLGRDDSSAANRNRWVFKVQTAAETGKSVMALSAGPAAVGQWTTLTGVYDARAKSISLYVDGALAQTVPVPGILLSGGPVEIGRARYKSHWVDAWNGSIADVQTWAQPLSAGQVAQLAQSRSTDVPPRASWFRS